jgi:hypothetical protein
MTIDNFCFYLQNRLIQIGQTGGQLYSDTSPFSVPWPECHMLNGIMLSVNSKSVISVSVIGLCFLILNVVAPSRRDQRSFHQRQSVPGRIKKIDELPSGGHGAAPEFRHRAATAPSAADVATHRRLLRV